MSNVFNKSVFHNGNKDSFDFVTKLRMLKVTGKFKMLSL